MTDPLLGGVGRYRIERLLGEGGMGRVYAGMDAQADHPVAIKVIGEEHEPSGRASCVNRRFESRV